MWEALPENGLPAASRLPITRSGERKIPVPFEGFERPVFGKRWGVEQLDLRRRVLIGPTPGGSGAGFQSASFTVPKARVVGGVLLRPRGAFPLLSLILPTSRGIFKREP